MNESTARKPRCPAELRPQHDVQCPRRYPAVAVLNACGWAPSLDRFAVL